ncbi:uncharacterized protein LOC112569021 isoform X2 [Pomacea canaliculata]|uniref:uncharacterized protein LOC112569021 isoform X2 n=1 Tax=Pomacea canaliculata TaxID=400727 RepID=UPI000D72BFED|nr:uncharacterized protein LOC112569021 isoform X2 [Pomacea canaliculata]
MTDKHHISSTTLRIFKQNIHKERRRTFYIILLLDIWIYSSGAAVVTDCPGEVDLLTHVNITCNFGNKPLQDSFRISLIRRINSSDQRKNVLTCQWQGTKHFCIPLRGYDYYTPITNSVVLVIKNVSSENLGSYICQRIQSDESDTPCEIKLRDPFDNATQEIPGNQTTDPFDNATQEIPGSQTAVPKEEAKDSLNVGLIVGLCVGLPLVIIPLFAIVYYFKIKKPGISSEQEMSHVDSNRERDSEATSV